MTHQNSKKHNSKKRNGEKRVAEVGVIKLIETKKKQDLELSGYKNLVDKLEIVTINMNNKIITANEHNKELKGEIKSLKNKIKIYETRNEEDAEEDDDYYSRIIAILSESEKYEPSPEEVEKATSELMERFNSHIFTS